MDRMIERICFNCRYHNVDSINENAWCYCELNRKEHSESGCEFYEKGKETYCSDFEFYNGGK